MRLAFGQRVRSRDGGDVGELSDVVVEPLGRRVTHLVVRSHHGGGAWLVPIELAAADDEGRQLSLRCDGNDLLELPDVEESSSLLVGDPLATDPDWEVGLTRVVLPYFESSGYADDGLGFRQDVLYTYDRVPKGKIEIERASCVITMEGRYVGEVDGFLVEDDQITHFVVERGHLWRRREVTIPIGFVAEVETGTVVVGLSMDELGALPSRRVHRLHLPGR